MQNGVKYNKKNVITYADLVYSDSRNGLNTQQKRFKEGRNLLWLKYMRFAGSTKCNLGKQRKIKKNYRI